MSAAVPARAARIVVLAGVCAALHIAKLPPAIDALRADLGLSLLQAGFLLSLVQLAGMTVGAAFGAVADRLGGRRSVITGLLVLTFASLAGGVARGPAALMVLRAVEGFGFLLVVLPPPGLLRQIMPPAGLSRMLGLWGAYMPFGTALALLLGPLVIEAVGWRPWWWAMAAATAVMALAVMRGVPALPASPGAAAGIGRRLRLTLAAPGPWLVAVTFAAYSSQWLAVIGFLPTIVAAQVGSGLGTGVLTAVVAAANMVGNIAAGRRLQAGVPAVRLLRIGFVTMALSAVAAFAAVDGVTLPPPLRFGAVLVFSLVGGLVPTTLFALALRVAPGEQTVAATVGWMQQWSALGQFAGPPLVAWIAARSGGWQWTWLFTAAAAAAGLGLSGAIARLLRRPPAAG
ncbi:MAG TPA: MFS transporter [Rubrivivax sp.]|nr:MFS transporter [Rubrivivax sp.]HRY89256.1 MFS transporter [Rubrivivax sp.]